VSRWNSWLESFHFHVNCIHFRGAVFMFSFTWIRHNCVGKWCFDSDVECCGSCMIRTIGVGTSKFLGVRIIFAQIFPNLPNKFWATLPANCFPQRSRKPFLGWPLKKVFMCFSAKTTFYGRHFMKSNKNGGHFAQIFRDFPRFSKILPGFSINQNFSGCACTPPPTLLVSTEFST